MWKVLWEREVLFGLNSVCSDTRDLLLSFLTDKLSADRKISGLSSGSVKLHGFNLIMINAVCSFSQVPVIPVFAGMTEESCTSRNDYKIVINQLPEVHSQNENFSIC
jgi:hypothetical protein